MSDYYTPRKTYGLYVPGSPQPFKISRTKIDLFLKCPKCFYLDRVCGVAQPPGYPFALNAAVDRPPKKQSQCNAEAQKVRTSSMTKPTL